MPEESRPGGTTIRQRVDSALDAIRFAEADRDSVVTLVANMIEAEAASAVRTRREQYPQDADAADVRRDVADQGTDGPMAGNHGERSPPAETEP